MEGIREKIERFKLKSEQLLKENKRAYIKDIYNTYFFCDILFVGENTIIFKPFRLNNINEKVTKYWADIIKIEEYKEKGTINNER